MIEKVGCNKRQCVTSVGSLPGPKDGTLKYFILKNCTTQTYYLYTGITEVKFQMSPNVQTTWYLFIAMICQMEAAPYLKAKVSPRAYAAAFSAPTAASTSVPFMEPQLLVELSPSTRAHEARCLLIFMGLETRLKKSKASATGDRRMCLQSLMLRVIIWVEMEHSSDSGDSSGRKPAHPRAAGSSE